MTTPNLTPRQRHRWHRGAFAIAGALLLGLTACADASQEPAATAAAGSEHDTTAQTPLATPTAAGSPQDAVALEQVPEAVAPGVAPPAESTDALTWSVGGTSISQSQYDDNGDVTTVLYEGVLDTACFQWEMGMEVAMPSLQSEAPCTATLTWAGTGDSAPFHMYIALLDGVWSPADFAEAMTGFGQSTIDEIEIDGHPALRAFSVSDDGQEYTTVMRVVGPSGIEGESVDGRTLVVTQAVHGSEYLERVVAEVRIAFASTP